MNMVAIGGNAPIGSTSE